jgi:hypothetical protein
MSVRLGLLRRTGVLLSGCLLVGAAMSGCGGSSSARPTTAASSSSAETSTTQTTTTQTTTSKSSVADLAAYFTAAANLDRQLKAAALAVNGDIGTSQITISKSTLDAIASANASEATGEIPAGLTARVLLPVLTVQSDLVSRYNAFRGFDLAAATNAGSISKSGSAAEYLLSCLANGSQAANSFAADLAAAEAAAAHAPALARVGARSRAAADLAVWLQTMLGANTGCMSCGGARLTALLPITWHYVSPRYGGNAWDGSVGGSHGLLFAAHYTASEGWSVQLNAC